MTTLLTPGQPLYHVQCDHDGARLMMANVVRQLSPGRFILRNVTTGVEWEQELVEETTHTTIASAVKAFLVCEIGDFNCGARDRDEAAMQRVLDRIISAVLACGPGFVDEGGGYWEADG